ncbi:MAG TPA: DNA mismatch repair endonuclease MutL [bacterium]|nr:DNA mismatch repair endonuclease MutL [bacterium]
MGIVKRLPEQLIDQIAAGEVIERPASVVKELVENALDAGATDIIVEVARGGREMIRVADDGSGMGQEDLFMALERHATSKLSDAQGLSRIATMGFRGEALPSIASVSVFSLASALAHGDGFRVAARGGVMTESGPVSRPKGTEATVGRLFFNLPARRKFLKSEEREFAHIKELIQRLAVTHPSIAFRLIHNERTALSFAAATSVADRAAEVWKAGRDETTLVEETAGHTAGTLLLGSPYRSFAAPATVTVNRRIVSDRRVNAVIYRVIRESVGGDHRPVYALSISLPPEEVDVNVHPAKSEVRFRDESAVFALIEALFRKGLAALRTGERSPELFPGAPTSPAHAALPRIAPSARPTGTELFSPPLPLTGVADTTPASFSPAIRITGYRVLGTLFDTYIAVEMGDALYLIDQHASHERIVYTRLREAMEKKSGLTQLTLLAEPVHLSPVEMAVWREHREMFADIGLTLEELDDETLVIRGVPALSLDPSWPSLVQDLLADIREQGFSSAWDEKFLSIAADRACKRAVRAGRSLAPEEIERLIADINASEVLTCPHGRPFFFVVSKRDIERGIGR